MGNQKNTNMKEELLNRHHQVMAKLREVELVRAYYENELENIEETVSCIAEISSQDENHEAASAHDLKVLEKLQNAPSHIKAMETIARMSNLTLDLEQASRTIKMAGLSKSPSKTLVSHLRHRAKDSPEWELIDQNTARLLTRGRPQENPDENHQPESQGDSPQDSPQDSQLESREDENQQEHNPWQPNGNQDLWNNTGLEQEAESHDPEAESPEAESLENEPLENAAVV